ncbi:hypothetical protein V8G54_023112 [Vigna mungo]|uniref:Uncharacterized protein n=1 Tax=Vigna mungo TaxID=3915 RepID=A0AAQ3N455_VIGMU
MASEKKLVSSWAWMTRHCNCGSEPWRWSSSLRCSRGTSPCFSGDSASPESRRPLRSVPETASTPPSPSSASCGEGGEQTRWAPPQEQTTSPPPAPIRLAPACAAWQSHNMKRIQRETSSRFFFLFLCYMQEEKEKRNRWNHKILRRDSVF